MEAAKKADPLRKREESLQREQVRIQKNIDRLVTALAHSRTCAAETTHDDSLRPDAEGLP